MRLDTRRRKQQGLLKQAAERREYQADGHELGGVLRGRGRGLMAEGSAVRRASQQNPETMAGEVAPLAKGTVCYEEGQVKLVLAPGGGLTVASVLNSLIQDQMGIVLLNARIHGNDRKRVKPIPAALLAELQSTFLPVYH
ncbi:unnamed protein product, partial [Prorocentrum cordatum]